MDFITSNILTIITFTPAVGALLLLFHKREHVRSILGRAMESAGEKKSRKWRDWQRVKKEAGA